MGQGQPLAVLFILEAQQVLLIQTSSGRNMHRSVQNGLEFSRNSSRSFPGILPGGFQEVSRSSRYLTAVVVVVGTVAEDTEGAQWNEKGGIHEPSGGCVCACTYLPPHVSYAVESPSD